MITALITLLIAALFLYTIWYLAGIFIKDAVIMKIIGVVLGLIFLLYALRLFHIPMP